MRPEILARFLLPGAGFLISLGSGLWLSRSGRPFNGLLFTAHKLIGLGAAVAAGVQIARLFRLAIPAASIPLAVLAGFCTLAMFASGALLSLSKPAPRFVLRVHQGIPLLLLASMAACLYQWMSGN